MKELFSKIKRKVRPKIKVSYYKLAVYFKEGASDLRAFIEVAEVLKMSQKIKIALATTGKYLDGIIAHTPDGNTRLTKKEVKSFVKSLKGIKGITLNLIRGIEDNGG
jgi:hypothetical protein